VSTKLNNSQGVFRIALLFCLLNGTDLYGKQARITKSLYSVQYALGNKVLSKVGKSCYVIIFSQIFPSWTPPPPQQTEGDGWLVLVERAVVYAVGGGGGGVLSHFQDLEGRTHPVEQLEIAI
jgi:hypothetical protein